MKKIILGVWGSLMLFSSEVFAQTSEVVLQDNEVTVWGISASTIFYFGVLALGALFTYWKKHEKEIMDKLKNVLSENIEGALLNKAMQHLVNAVVSAVEITYNDLYKELKKAAGDRKLTEAEIKELRVYAIIKAKSFIPLMSRNILKKHGVYGDENFIGKIEETVKRLKRENIIAKAMSDAKSNIDEDDDE